MDKHPHIDSYHLLNDPFDDLFLEEVFDDAVPPPPGTNTTRLIDIVKPKWGDHERILPTEFAKSSLFTVRHKSSDERWRSEDFIPVAGSTDGPILEYNGEELGASDDLLIWMQILHYGRTIPLGHRIDISINRLCKDIGWSSSKIYYERCRNSIRRLKNGVVFLRRRDLKFNLLAQPIDSDNPQLPLEIAIDPALGTLLSERHVRVNWKIYRQLHPIGRRLYDYLASHPTPHPIRLETLAQYFGTDSRRLPRWKNQVKEACARLKESGVAAKAYINDRGLVVLERADLEEFKR
jgi:hypothetical protein